MRLTQADAGFLYGELANGPMQTAAVVVLDGELPFDKFYAHLHARIHLVPALRQRLAWVPMNLGHPVWTDDTDFDPTRHIVHHAMRSGATLNDAIDAAVELNQGLMDRSRPLWKYVLITGVPGYTVLLQQIHHAMIDGASAVHLSTVLLDFERDAPAPPPEKSPWEPAPAPTAAELATAAVRENVESFVRSNPLSVARRDATSARLLQRGVETMSRFVTQPAITAPWNAGILGTRRRMRWFSRPFAEMREVRRGLGGTINDVALTAVSEGAARYLASAGEAARDGSFRIMVPVNVRTEDQAGALGNRVSAIFPLLPARQMDVVERLAAVEAETRSLKETQQAQAMTLMQESGINLPPVAMAPLQWVGTPFDPSALSAMNPPPPAPRVGPRPPFLGINFTCTNVPGVQVPQYCAGHEVIEMAGIMMLGGTLGMGVAVGSYNQKMIISFTVEPRLLPDLEGLLAHTEQAFDELLSAAREQLGTGPTLTAETSR